MDQMNQRMDKMNGPRMIGTNGIKKIDGRWWWGIIPRHGVGIRAAGRGTVVVHSLQNHNAYLAARL